MDRLEVVRQVVDEIVRQQPDKEYSRCGFVHLYGVAAICVLLGLKRGLDPHLCAVTGMLHDISSYKTGDSTDHARRSSLEARHILNATNEFTQAEITEICEAIAQHSTKGERDGLLSELIKDADVAQHFLYNPILVGSPAPSWEQRLNKVLSELGLARVVGL